MACVGLERTIVPPNPWRIVGPLHNGRRWMNSNLWRLRIVGRTFNSDEGAYRMVGLHPLLSVRASV
jgi:hypothetical protein